MPSTSDGHDMHLSAPFLDRWRGATRNATVERSGLERRPVRRTLAVERDDAKPSHRLIPGPFLGLKKAALR